MNDQDMPAWRLFLSIVLKAFYHDIFITNPKGDPLSIHAHLQTLFVSAMSCCTVPLYFCFFCHCSVPFLIVLSLFCLQNGPTPCRTYTGLLPVAVTSRCLVRHQVVSPSRLPQRGREVFLWAVPRVTAFLGTGHPLFVPLCDCHCCAAPPHRRSCCAQARTRSSNP